MTTDMAIFTVLKYLGIPARRSIGYVYQFHGYTGIEKFEEIRHHCIQFEYPKAYKQNKYFGEKHGQ